MLTLEPPHNGTHDRTCTGTRNPTLSAQPGAREPVTPAHAAEPSPNVAVASLDPDPDPSRPVPSETPGAPLAPDRAIISALLDPETDPRDIAEAHEVPLQTVLDIFESDQCQTLMTRLERMQHRRAEFHLSHNKPLAARNLTLLLEASLEEEMTRATRDTSEAASLRQRQRETTRRAASQLFRGPGSLETSPSAPSPKKAGSSSTPPPVPRSALARERDHNDQTPPLGPPNEPRMHGRPCADDRPPLASSPDDRPQATSAQADHKRATRGPPPPAARSDHPEKGPTAKEPSR